MGIRIHISKKNNRASFGSPLITALCRNQNCRVTNYLIDITYTSIRAKLIETVSGMLADRLSYLSLSMNNLPPLPKPTAGGITHVCIQPRITPTPVFARFAAPRLN